MAISARKPSTSIFTKKFSDLWLLAGLGVITLLATSTLALRCYMLVTDLDQEFGQVVQMQRDIRTLKEDVRANKMLNDSWHEEIVKSLNGLTSAPNDGRMP